MEDEDYYQLELPIEAVRIIYTGLSQACEKWSGGDPERARRSTRYERSFLQNHA